MHPLLSQLADLLLLTFAAGIIGFKLGSRAKARKLRIGQRVLWLKPTSKGNLKPVRGFVRVIVGPMVRIENLDATMSTWIHVSKIARR